LWERWENENGKSAMLAEYTPTTEASFVDPLSEPGPSEPRKKKPKRCEWEINMVFQD